MPAKLKPPPIQSFRTLQGLPYELDQMQRNIKAATKPARSNPENRARVIESVSVPVGTFNVFHKLGKRPQGYSVQRTVAGAPAFSEVSRNSRLLEFSGSVAGIVDLKVW